MTAQDGGCSVMIPADGKYYRAGARERLRRERRVPVPPAHRQLPRGPRRSCRRAGSTARNSKSRSSATPVWADQAEGQAARPRPTRSGGCTAPRRKGTSPTGFKFRLGDLPNALESAEQQHGRDRGPAPASRSGGVQRCRSRSRGRGRLLQVPGEKGAGLRRALLRPADRLAARPGAVLRHFGRRRGRSPATTTAAGRTATSASPIPGRQGTYTFCGSTTTLQQGRAGLLLPHRGDARSAAHHDQHPEGGRQQPERTRTGRRSPSRRAGGTPRCCSATAPTSAGRW